MNTLHICLTGEIVRDAPLVQDVWNLFFNWNWQRLFDFNVTGWMSMESLIRFSPVNPKNVIQVDWRCWITTKAAVILRCWVKLQLSVMNRQKVIFTKPRRNTTLCPKSTYTTEPNCRKGKTLKKKIFIWKVFQPQLSQPESLLHELLIIVCNFCAAIWRSSM